MKGSNSVQQSVKSSVKGSVKGVSKKWEWHFLSLMNDVYDSSLISILKSKNCILLNFADKIYQYIILSYF